MPVRVICKSYKDPIKTKEALLRTRSNMLFFLHSIVNYSEVSDLIWSGF